jgi:predicted transcriptional regulator
MSIQPQWSRLIQSGVKTVELRRQSSGCKVGTTVVIYTSFPVKRVEALATVAAVHATTPAALWRAVGTASATPRDQFMAYVGDLDIAYGIELTDVRAVKAFALPRSGPQSWRYLFGDEGEAQAILSACNL